MANVEDDTTFAAFYHAGVHLAFRCKLATQTGITVGIDVAGAQLCVNNTSIGRSGRFAPKSTITGILAALPASTACSTGVLSGGIMGGLNADDDVRIFFAISAAGAASMSA